MKSKYSDFIPLFMVVLCCLTTYLCVREMCKAQLAITAIERGVIGVKK